VNTGKHRSARQRAAQPALRLELTVVKVIGLGSLLAMVLVGGLQTASSGGDGTTAVDDAYDRVVERAVTDHRCSFGRLDRGAQATSALIRTVRGDVRVVSFEKGWDVYNGKRPGDLIAVCLEDAETARIKN
jgi:hypothetical protein